MATTGVAIHDTPAFGREAAALGDHMLEALDLICRLENSNPA
jgi:hypothetical protein